MAPLAAMRVLLAFPNAHVLSKIEHRLLVKQVNIVRYAALVQELVELLIVSAMEALDLAIEVRRPRGVARGDRLGVRGRSHKPAPP